MFFFTIQSPEANNSTFQWFLLWSSFLIILSSGIISFLVIKKKPRDS